MKTLANQPKTLARTESEMYEKGMKLMDRKRFASAQKNFDIILLLNPHNIDALLQRGICKMNAGMVNLALEDFSEILAQADGKPETYAALAQAYWMLADYSMAKHFIDETIKNCRIAKAEWYEMGFNIYYKLGDVSTAYSFINRAIVCNPFDAVLYFKRARVLHHMSKFQVAINDLSKAISFEPRFKNAFKLRAECKKALGDINGSRQDSLLALQLTN